MSNELQRRLASIEKKIFASPSPCRQHFPGIIYRKASEDDERIKALLEAMDECPTCGPAKLGGGPRVLVVGMPRGVVDPLSSQAVTPQRAATDHDSKIAGAHCKSSHEKIEEQFNAVRHDRCRVKRSASSHLVGAPKS